MTQDHNTSDVEQKTGYGVEELQVVGEQLLARVRELLHEGNVRRIIIRHDDRTLLEIPLTLGVAGAAASLVVAPIAAAVGALGALLAHVEVQVIRTEEPGTGTPVDVYTPPTTTSTDASTTGYTGTASDSTTGSNY